MSFLSLDIRVRFPSFIMVSEFYDRGQYFIKENVVLYIRGEYIYN